MLKSRQQTVAWPSHGSEVGGDFALIQTFLHLSCKSTQLALEQLNLKAVGSVSKQGHHQRQCHSMARPLSRQLYNDLLFIMLQVSFRNTLRFQNWGISLRYSQFQLGNFQSCDLFRLIVREQNVPWIITSNKLLTYTLAVPFDIIILSFLAFCFVSLERGLGNSQICGQSDLRFQKSNNQDFSLNYF